jgi:hypothetical protein
MHGETHIKILDVFVKYKVTHFCIINYKSFMARIFKIMAAFYIVQIAN